MQRRPVAASLAAWRLAGRDWDARGEYRGQEYERGEGLAVGRGEPSQANHLFAESIDGYAVFEADRPARDGWGAIAGGED